MVMYKEKLKAVVTFCCLFYELERKPVCYKNCSYFLSLSPLGLRQTESDSHNLQQNYPFCMPSFNISWLRILDKLVVLRRLAALYLQGLDAFPCVLINIVTRKFAVLVAPITITGLGGSTVLSRGRLKVSVGKEAGQVLSLLFLHPAARSLNGLSVCDV
ncbi:hypothetical protein EK904_003762 [Melospiza melodia maxima]|nr:hypothetical protein EK904_003762 [Melospiza melodia maxima]